MPRLSIIVTFYDETAFIDMAIASIVSQPIEDLEVIIVNDNPTKFSPEYFDGLNLHDCVTVVHHPENKGLSAARNTGITASSAPMIGFLDGDDYYVTDGLAQQFALAVDSDADITHAACFLSHAGSPEIDMLRRDRLLFNSPNRGPGLEHFEEAQFITSSWASLYRRDFLDLFELRFDEEQPKFEDRLFVLHAVTAARRITTLGAATRVWRQRGGSISVTATDPFIHRLQVQLIEKCLTHIRAEVGAGRLPPRFEKRELFNTVGRLIWDMDIIDPIVAADDPVYAEFAERIVTLLGSDRFGSAIFDDPILTHISRVGMRTRKGFIKRATFFAMHKALREGDFAGVQSMLKTAVDARAAHWIRSPKPVDVDVIVHLGMHKTGSTYLQHHLIHHRDALLKAGILVPGARFQDSNLSGAIRDGAFSGHTNLVKALRNPRSDTWDMLRSEVLQSGAHTVLISCENMLFPINNDRDEMIPRLMDQLGMFRSIRTNAFVRRPDTYVEAMYKEIVANGRRMGSRSVQEFMVDHMDNLTNLPALFNPIEVRAGQPVTLLDFDVAVKAKALWPTFRTACGLPDSLDALDLPTYPSAGRNGTQAARLVNTLISDQSLRQRMLRDLFASLPPEPDKMSVLSPTERLMLIDKFEMNSTTFAQARGYAPDYAKLRKSVPQKWTPTAGMNAATLAVLEQTRLRSELPAAPPPTQPAPAAPAPEKIDETPIQPAKPVMTLRIRPRPWLVSLLKMRPFR